MAVERMLIAGRYRLLEPVGTGARDAPGSGRGDPVVAAGAPAAETGQPERGDQRDIAGTPQQRGAREVPLLQADQVGFRRQYPGQRLVCRGRGI